MAVSRVFPGRGKVFQAVSLRFPVNPRRGAIWYALLMKTDSPHVLVVDDDAGLRSLLQRYLGENGFEVRCAADAVEMDRLLVGTQPDLIVLDLMLPGEDGLSIARRLRGATDIPIIMLSARGEEVDRIVGLEVGADDYLPKPFNPRELLARIRAVLRRHGPAGESAETPRSDGIRFGEFRFDPASQQLTRAQERIPLTSGELGLLDAFVHHPNRVLTRDMLVDLIKGFDRSPFDRSIDVRVTRLRRKLERDPANPVFIRTVWGKGYMFTPQGEPLSR
ncbi:winged helix family two component transcriptional regulator [Thioalbus denitrificans]|uniref:Winged helix family two component transcriptional regulator n=2 Tax=Thioalbus denitrificans TaxID=547122 RepID=A0A369C8F1_9GAMM|nr:winged helix family two component transcriptional regulator [Thioalbus denitrificans]